MTEVSWDVPHVHAPETNEEELVLESGLDDPNVAFTVYLEDRKTKYSPEQFIQACWTNGFNTPCSICGEAFDLAVSLPVRLLSLDKKYHETNPLAEALPPLTITNYHLKCVKSAKLKYYPISHAWHPSIAEAYAFRIANLSAAWACYKVPARTLLAVVRRFGPDVYLWHDYISIPQWQGEFRGTTILPLIFEIFRESSCTIIHVGLQPPVEVLQNPSIDTLTKHNADLRRFFSAHLFSRLWPVVEFDCAPEAYVMSNKYEIMADVFSVFLKQIQDVTDTGAVCPQSPETLALQWINELPLFVRERQERKCLGYVFDMIWQQECHSFRDKFVGAAELLEVPKYSTELPPIAQDACLWLCERQLESNDLSPLLLRPSDGPKYAKARWLKGHTIISANMFGLGVQTHPALAPPQLQDHAVHLQLDMVGTITHTWSWGLLTDNAETAIPKVLWNAMKPAAVSAIDFLQSLENINPPRLGWTDNASNSNQFSALQFQLPPSEVIGKTMMILLEQFNKNIDREDTTELKALCDAIISLIALSASKPMPNFASFTNLGSLKLCSHLCNPSERSLISVCCPSCHKTSISRSEIWHKPTIKARLYLIPGLGYQYSVPNGTGILVENEEIIGRTRFGASACDCNRAVTVKLS
jgi:hypothetical protein